MMTIQFKYISLAVIAAFFISCSPSRQTTSAGSDLGGMQHVMLDTMEVNGGGEDMGQETRPDYNPADERRWDLLHTSLDLSFDWAKESVQGKATLTLTPLFYTQDSIQLDAIGFDINSITIDAVQIKSFLNTTTQIIIPLSRQYKKGEQLTIVIDYAAHPSASGEDTGEAITSDKGLFFIDPQDTIPGVPTQLWTQGETTNSSRWFPTLDQPN